MMEKYYSIKEFAEAANISQQAVYKQLSGRLAPYVILEGKQKMIKAAALQKYYSPQSQKVANPDRQVEQPRVETVENPESEGIKEEQPQGNIKPSTQPEHNPDRQVEQPDERPQKELEQKIEELQQQLNKLIQENAEEKAFLKEQIQKKDKQIDELSENLRTAQQNLRTEQQLAAADKKKLLELEDKEKQLHEEKAAASDIVIDPDKEPEEQPQKKSFWQRLFGR